MPASVNALMKGCHCDMYRAPSGPWNRAAVSGVSKIRIEYFMAFSLLDGSGRRCLLITMSRQWRVFRQRPGTGGMSLASDGGHEAARSVQPSSCPLLHVSPESGVSQHGQELRAVALQLERTDAIDGGQRLAVLGTFAQHRVESGVVEDHVGGHALFLRELRPRIAQGIPQGFLVRRDVEAAAVARNIRTTAGAALRAVRFLAQVHGLVASQDRVRGRRQVQGSVAFEIGTQQAAGDQLPEHAAPLPRIESGADAVHGKMIVALGLDARVVLAEQHVDQVTDAEPLAGAVHA